MATQTATRTAQQPSLQPTRDSAISSSYIPRGPVTTNLNFYQPPADGSTPFNYVEEPPEGVPQRNFDGADFEVTINDIRGHEGDFNIDTNAFAALANVGESAEKEFVDDSSIKQKYYPEVESLLLAHVPGAKRVLIFDHTIRRANTSRTPVQRVHIDQTTKSATARVHHHLPDEAEELLKSRFRIINIWRPLNGAVERHPLAFADSLTVSNAALVPIEHRYPDRTGETAAVLHKDEKWFYWSGMGNEERLLLECFDSEKGGRVPHSAFVDPRSKNVEEGGKERESIEVRALVFG